MVYTMAAVTMMYASVLAPVTHGATIRFAINLDGDQAGTGSVATGQGTATLNTDMSVLQWEVAFDAAAFAEGPDSVTAAQFHSGAPGVSGPPIVPPGNVMGTGVSPMTGTAMIGAVEKAQLVAGALYFNIHTTAFPDGEIRGQVVPDSAVLVASRDNTLYENPAGSRSNGAGQYLFAGRDDNGQRKRGLLLFDVAASGIPSGSTVTWAVLTLNMSKSRAGAETVELRRALKAWGEGVSNAPDNEGGGATATPGDATWLHTSFDSGLWDTPGGDFADAASAVAAVDLPGPYTWASTPAMVADVQMWLDQSQSNFGWLLLGNESTRTTAKRFDSRESTTTANRPVLEIGYTGPCLFELAGDINHDCRVDLLDFMVMASHWLTDCQTLPLDPACIPR